MNRQDVEQIISAHIKPIFGFALKRAKSIEDAEDLSQEIVMRAWQTLLAKDDVADMSKFIWTVAHHALSNYYRDFHKRVIGTGDLTEVVAEERENDDRLARLQSEIAYLSRQQRQIVIAYYFENRRQTEIAQQMDLPLGTVKWHLFEAKKELKRGMETMRKASELKFNPIQFRSFSTNGSISGKTPDEYFTSILVQNICYSARKAYKTVNEIADDLGVSPVYVENEVEILERNGFLAAKQNSYIANFMINEIDADLLVCKDRMYKQAAKLFSDDLYEELTSSGILCNADIDCGAAGDENFLLWSLVPYIAGFSTAKKEEGLRFETVATIRPDGSRNIFQADVWDEPLDLPEDYVYMDQWNGPMWNEIGGKMLWQIDSRWSDRGIGFGFQDEDEARRVLRLYERAQHEELSKDECAYLAERGYAKIRDGRCEWQVVVLKNARIKAELLAMGTKIKEKHCAAFEELQKEYAQMCMQRTPGHLKRVREYELQGVLDCNGCFLYHCVTHLLRSGKLKKPKPEQKKALDVMIVVDNA